MRHLQKRASSAIGHMVALGQQLLSPEVKAYIADCLLPLASTYLNGLPYRVSKGYAMLLLVTKLVSIFRVFTKICYTVLCTQILFYSCVT